MYYKLDEEKNPTPCSLVEAGEQFRRSVSRIVAKNEVGEAMISTVFLVIDHSFLGGIPILFETMVFGGKHNELQERYSTWKEACEGHLKILDMIRKEGA